MKISDRHVPMSEASLSLSEHLNKLIEQHDLSIPEVLWLLQSLQNQIFGGLIKRDDANRRRAESRQRGR